MHKRAVISLLLPLAICACGNPRPANLIDKDPESIKEPVEDSADSYEHIEVEGHFIIRSKGPFFHPCNLDEQWWVVPGDGLAKTYSGMAPHLAGRRGFVYVRLAGMISGPGRYGSDESAVREFIVGRVLEIRLSEDGDCR
jgi:hypothetical protein